MPHIDTPPPPSTSERRSVASRVLRASFVVMIAHLSLKFVSIIQYKLVGQFCDDITRDLFIFAYEGVLGMLFLVGEESLGPAFLPVFMERMDKDGEESAWGFANTILVVQAVIITLVVGLVAWQPQVVVGVITKWRKTGVDPEYMRMAPLYARYMVLGLFGMSLGSTTYMLLNGYKRFFLAAFGDAMLKLGIVIGLAVAWAMHANITGRNVLITFTLGVVLGSLLKLGTHLTGLRDKLGQLRMKCSWSNPGLRKFILLIAPLLLGIIFAKVRDIYVNIRMLSDLDPGLLSATAFGRKIFESIRYMIPYAVSIAMLPFFCEMVDQNKREDLARLVTRSSRLILFMCMPVAALLAALSLPLARVLFQGGHYDFVDCINASMANGCYSLVLPFAALETVFMQVFFANRKMISVVVIGLIFSSLSIVISYVGIERIGFSGTSAVATVALAFTISRTLKTLFLGALMRRFVPAFPARETASFIIRMLSVTITTGIVAWLTRMGYERLIYIPLEGGNTVILPRVGPQLVVSGLAGGIVCLGLMYRLCREEFILVMDWGLARLHRKPKVRK